MKKILTLIIVSFIITSCNDNKTNTQEKKIESSIVISDNKRLEFEKWLLKNKIDDFDLISNAYTFELWAYSDLLKPKDSLLYWYPSKDSSYKLITNLNKSNGNRLSDKNIIDLRFLDSKTNLVYLGIGIIDSLQKKKVTFHWYDENTFFYITEYDNKRSMSKLKMTIDSIWNYKIKTTP